MSSPEFGHQTNPAQDPNAMPQQPDQEAASAQAPAEHASAVETAGFPPAETNPIQAETPPMTSEEITARWGQLQGGWQRLKGAVGGAVGRVRAAVNKETYDPGKHNRAVQNQLYRHLGEAPVRNFLATNDPRHAQYAAGSIGKGEKKRELVGNTALFPVYAVALLGVSALRGFEGLALKGAGPNSPIAISAREAQQKRERKGGPDAWQKHNERASREREQPSNPRQRSSAVQYQENREKTARKTAQIVAEMQQRTAA